MLGEYWSQYNFVQPSLLTFMKGLILLSGVTNRICPFEVLFYVWLYPVFEIQIFYILRKCCIFTKAIL